MASIHDVEGCWERFELVDAGHLRNQLLWVDVQLFLLHTRAKVEVEAPVEPLVDQSIIEGDVPQLPEALRNEVGRSVFFFHFLPLFQLFFVEQVLLRWVVGLVVGRQSYLRSRYYCCTC